MSEAIHIGDRLVQVGESKLSKLQKDNWAIYQNFLSKYSSNPQLAVRQYLCYIMRKNESNFIKLFGTKDKYMGNLKGLKTGDWLTDDNMYSFAASLGFRLTVILKNTEVSRYDAPLNFAGFSVSEDAPVGLLVLESSNHWRPHEVDVPGDGNCGAHTCVYFADRLKARLGATATVPSSECPKVVTQEDKRELIKDSVELESSGKQQKNSHQMDDDFEYALKLASCDSGMDLENTSREEVIASQCARLQFFNSQKSAADSPLTSAISFGVGGGPGNNKAGG